MVRPFLLILGVFLFELSAFTQCSELSPSIESTRLDSFFEGSVLLCDLQDREVMTTEEYDGYQWFRQELSIVFPNPNPAVAVPGATMQTLEVAMNDTTFYSYWVEVVSDTCVVASDTVLIDGYSYALPAMKTLFEEGTVQQIGDSEYNVCDGSVVKFNNLFNEIYDKHTWFKCVPATIPHDSLDPCIIPDITGDSLSVSSSGTYTFYACSDYCPDQCYYLGVSFTLNFGNFGFCNSSIEDPDLGRELLVYPNPASDLIYFDNEANIDEGHATVYNITGQLMWEDKAYSIIDPIDISQFSSGMYVVLLRSSDGVVRFRSKFVKK